MKKNGFTLIELIATIGLLGMLATILITVSVKKINETKEHSKNTMIESIELAAKQYVMDYKDELSDFQKNDYIYVTLQTLVEKNYFSKSLIDPTTNKSLPLTDTVYVTREQNGEINAVYDMNQKEKAKLTLNGSYNEYIKEGTPFTDLGVNAISSDGNNISSSVITTSTVDTTTPGTYKIKYEYGDISIERNVIVYEGNLPSEIILPVFINYNANKGTFGTTKYDYTGGEQIFQTPNDGYYKVEAWGSQGGNSTYGGKGGYIAGVIKLNKGDKLYVYVGSMGPYNATVTNIGGYNGGGYSGNNSSYKSYGGGGATDIRINNGSWSDSTGLNSRIMVAAGGAGTSSAITTNAGGGGGLIGGNGTTSISTYNNSTYLPIGSGQSASGFAYGTTARAGSFGYAYQSNTSGYGGGGGGGYYGGGNGH